MCVKKPKCCIAYKGISSLHSWFRRWLKRRQSRKVTKVRRCSEKDCMERAGETSLCDNCNLKDLLWNFDLNNVDPFSLFNEFLEMGTDMFLNKQHGFTSFRFSVIVSQTIFLCIYPSVQFSSSVSPPSLWLHFLWLLCSLCLTTSLRSEWTPSKWSVWSEDWFPGRLKTLVRAEEIKLFIYFQVQLQMTIHTTFDLCRCLDRCSGNNWCASCHCQWASHWHIL